MPVCTLDDNDYCERHQRRHLGVVRALALDPGHKGEFYRLEWDKHLLIESGRQRRPRSVKSQEKSRQDCVYLGDEIRDENGKAKTRPCDYG